MKKYSLLTLILVVVAFLGGCATTENGLKKGTDKEKVRIEPVKVSEFILGAGDTIEITVYRHDDLKKTVKVGTSGKIMFPLIGDVQAAGISIFQLRDNMQERLSIYIVDPQVTISVTTVQSQKIIVLGEVNNPGAFTLDTDITLMEAISKAGGMTEDAKSSNVLLIRKGQGKSNVVSMDFKKVIKKGDLSQNIVLQSDDIIYVPAVAIADVSWFFSHLSRILSPIVNLESGIVLWPQVKDVFEGEKTITPLTIPAQ